MKWALLYRSGPSGQSEDGSEVLEEIKLARTDLDACELSDDESLQKFYKYYGSDFKVECPSGSGRFLTIREVANELARRLTRIFLKDESGHRPVSTIPRKCGMIQISGITFFCTSSSLARTAAASEHLTRRAGRG